MLTALSSHGDSTGTPDYLQLHPPRGLSNVRIAGGVRDFQVIGERSSGTNYVRTLLQQNTPLRSRTLAGWKHGFPTFPALPDDFLLICVFRNALDWVRSMFAKPWHAAGSMRELAFAEFLRARWDTVIDEGCYFNLNADDGRVARPLQYDRHPIDGSAFANIVALRNAKIAAHLGLANRGINVAFLRLEEIEGREAAVLAELSDSYGFDLESRIEVPDGRFGFKDDWPKRSASILSPPEGLADDDRMFVLDQLDRTQEAKLGYRYRSSDVDEAVR